MLARINPLRRAKSPKDGKGDSLPAPLNESVSHSPSLLRIWRRNSQSAPARSNSIRVVTRSQVKGPKISSSIAMTPPVGVTPRQQRRFLKENYLAPDMLLDLHLRQSSTNSSRSDTSVSVH